MPTKNHPIVGPVTYSVNSNGSLSLPSSFTNKITRVYIPQLYNLPTYGARFSGNVMFYTPAHPQLKAAFQELENLELTHLLLTWDGSFVPRLMRGGSSSPSEHSFGCALDLNAQWNGFRQIGAAEGKKGSVIPLLPTFRKFGFECGADWKPANRDSMHFQIKTLLSQVQCDKLLSQTKPKPPYPSPENPQLILNDRPIPNSILKNGSWYAPANAIPEIANKYTESPSSYIKVVESLQKHNFQIAWDRIGDHRAKTGKFYVYAYHQSPK